MSASRNAAVAELDRAEVEELAAVHIAALEGVLREEERSVEVDEREAGESAKMRWTTLDALNAGDQGIPMSYRRPMGAVSSRWAVPAEYTCDVLDPSRPLIESRSVRAG